MYRLFVQRQDTINGKFYTEYEVSTGGLEDYESVIKFAQKVRKSLKENYYVFISEVKEVGLGHVLG